MWAPRRSPAPRSFADSAAAAAGAGGGGGGGDAAATASAGKAITVDVTADGIAVVTLDIPGEKMNTLSTRLTDEFTAVLDRLESDAGIKAAVLISGKDDNFVAGADIKQLQAAKSAADLEALSKGGQDLMNRLAGLKKPVVAAINGACLGGGLELALACHYRVASSHPKTVLGVPEVMLGLLPGAGGTQRLPALVGLQEALGMALAGGNVKPSKAKRTGLVNVVADPFALKDAALQAARGLVDGSVKAGPKKKGALARVLEDTSIGRSIVFDQATKKVKKTAGDHYPAPYAILKCVKAGVEGGLQAGLKVEREEFGKLGGTSVSQSLVGIFFGQTACRKNPYGKPAHPVDTVGVLGAGLMGGGIAQVSAKAGYRVVLKDQDAKSLARGEANIANEVAPLVKRRRMTSFDRDVMLSRIVGTTADSPIWQKHIAKSDLVIEAVFEDLAVKHAIVKEIEPLIADHAVLATNTSALPIADIAKVAARPERIIGMHYFSPVPKMPLLEVIPHEGTSDDAAATAVSVGLKQGKTIIVVKDVPGFYVNRCLAPFMVESIALLQSGVDPLKLDKVMKSFGFPVGPVSLADEVGMDVAGHVSAFMSDKIENRMDGANGAAMQEMIAAGLLGRKSGKGFYSYAAPNKKKKGAVAAIVDKLQGKSAAVGRQVTPEAAAILKKYQSSDEGASLTDDDIAHRMVWRFVNEAVRCLEDGIIRSPADGDIGAVFGMGFPPFLGGPFRYVDHVGAQAVVDQMNAFADRYGAHFAPPQLLLDHAKAGTKFHPL